VRFFGKSQGYAILQEFIFKGILFRLPGSRLGPPEAYSSALLLYLFSSIWSISL
jgi:hypothetical protein